MIPNADCRGCRFWNPMRDSMGQCRRHAPQPRMWAIGEEEMAAHACPEAIFPWTGEDQWCGEFEPEAHI